MMFKKSGILFAILRGGIWIWLRLPMSHWHPRIVQHEEYNMGLFCLWFVHNGVVVPSSPSEALLGSNCLALRYSD